MVVSLLLVLSGGKNISALRIFSSFIEAFVNKTKASMKKRKKYLKVYLIKGFKYYKVFNAFLINCSTDKRESPDLSILSIAFSATFLLNPRDTKPDNASSF